MWEEMQYRNKQISNRCLISILTFILKEFNPLIKWRRCVFFCRCSYTNEMYTICTRMLADLFFLVPYEYIAIDHISLHPAGISEKSKLFSESDILMFCFVCERWKEWVRKNLFVVDPRNPSSPFIFLPRKYLSPFFPCPHFNKKLILPPLARSFACLLVRWPSRLSNFICHLTSVASYI